MKLSPEDITPELLQGALREMMDEIPSTNQKELGRVITNCLKLDEPTETMFSMIENIISQIPSCYEDGICFCQARCIFCVALVCGVKMANTKEDLRDLERLSL